MSVCLCFVGDWSVLGWWAVSVEDVEARTALDFPRSLKSHFESYKERRSVQKINT
jgi:hypothetical protein